MMMLLSNRKYNNFICARVQMNITILPLKREQVNTPLFEKSCLQQVNFDIKNVTLHNKSICINASKPNRQIAKGEPTLSTHSRLIVIAAAPQSMLLFKVRHIEVKFTPAVKKNCVVHFRRIKWRFS